MNGPAATQSSEKTKKTNGYFSLLIHRPGDERRWSVLTMLWSAATITMIGLTWRLWTGESNFPQIPLIQSLTPVPKFVDWIGLMILLSSCSWLMVESLSTAFGAPYTSRLNRIPAIFFVAAMLAMFALNQQRLQPWAWQFFLYAALIVVAKNRADMVHCARWLTASIYFYSAIGKFDYQFIYGLGGQLAGVFAATAGIASGNWLNVAAFAMPVFELLVAVLLVFAPDHKTGVVLAAVFHGALIATLGPWGLDHHTGVLVWNLFFFLITAILFWPLGRTATPATLFRIPPTVAILTVALTTYPLLPHVDHWLAWGLYSPNNSRCDLEVLQPNDDGEIIWQRVDLGSLSLQQLGVPLYPEARFQLGVATALRKERDQENNSRIILRSKSNRLTGQRRSLNFEESESWHNIHRSFFFNWKPRTL